MNGGLTTVDSADKIGNWASYVVGTGQSGALHYALKLSGCTSSTSACTPVIDSVFLDSQPGASSTPATAPQAPAIWWDASGVAYAYYFTINGSTAYLNSMRLYDGQVKQTSLGFTPSSTVNIDVLGGKLYAGDTQGNVWMFDLTTRPEANKLTPTKIRQVTNATSAGPICYIGTSQTSNGMYIWATTDHSVDVFKFTGGSVTSSTSGWTLWWWIATNGSGYLNGTGMITTTSDPGVSSTTAPYWIDASGTITDASAIINNTLIVPVTVGQSSNACAATIAKYGFFNLDNGVFPKGRFYLLNGSTLTSNLIVGYGTAYSPVLSQNQSGSGLIYGSAQQNLQQKVGFQVAATTGIHVGAGVMGWQPLWMTKPSGGSDAITENDFDGTFDGAMDDSRPAFLDRPVGTGCRAVPGVAANLPQTVTKATVLSPEPPANVPKGWRPIPAIGMLPVGVPRTGAHLASQAPRKQPPPSTR
jgi:type IV pilus assembly protein PilY1